MSKLNVIEQTPARLVIQPGMHTSCIPKGVHISYDHLPMFLIVIGAVLMIDVFSISLGSPAKTMIDNAVSMIISFGIFYVGELMCLVGWWKRSDSVISITYIFDHTTREFVIDTKWLHSSEDKSVYKLEAFKSIEINKPIKPENCYDLIFNLDAQGATYMLSSKDAITIEVPQLIADFLHIPLLETFQE